MKLLQPWLLMQIPRLQKRGDRCLSSVLRCSQALPADFDGRQFASLLSMQDARLKGRSEGQMDKAEAHCLCNIISHPSACLNHRFMI